MFSILLASALTFFHVQVPVVNIYEKPNDDSGVVSQAIFSEEVHVLHSENNWTQIQMPNDSGLGWIPTNTIFERTAAYADCTCMTPLVQVNSLAADIYRAPCTSDDAIMTLPFESRLESQDPFENPDSDWIQIFLPDSTPGYIQRCNIITDIRLLEKDELDSFSKKFLNVPFTQGGRSSFGYDDSGFTQMLYQQMGFSIPKSVVRQFHWENFEEISLDQLTTGDLIFWGQNADQIEHVGMSIGDGQFIHSATDEQQPRVKINMFDTPFYKSGKRWRYIVGKRIKQ